MESSHPARARASVGAPRGPSFLDEVRARVWRLGLTLGVLVSSRVNCSHRDGP